MDGEITEINNKDIFIMDVLEICGQYLFCNTAVTSLVPK